MRVSRLPSVVLLSLLCLMAFQALLLPTEANPGGNYVLFFDGTNNYVEVGDAASLNVSTGDFTFSVWFYAQQGDNSPVVFLKADAPWNYCYYVGLSKATAKTEDGLGNGTDWWGGLANTTYSWETWHNLMLIRDGDSLLMYLDSACVRSDAGVDDADCDSNQNLYLGYDHNGASTPYKGYMEEFRVFNRALNTTEIEYSYENIQNILNQTGLVLWFDFNEGAGSTVTDNSGNGNSGSISGATYTLASPNYRNAGQEATVVDQDESINLYAEGYSGAAGLDYAWLSTDETGSWKNHTQYGSFIQNATDNYFADNGIAMPFHYWNYPPALQASGSTFIVYQGSNLDPYAIEYNHTSEAWSSSVQIGDNPLSSDSHGVPSIIQNDAGYFLVFYGDHNSKIQWAKSDSPNDISSWTDKGNWSDTDYTYHFLEKDSDGNLYLFTRKKPLNDDQFVYRKSNDSTPDSGDSWDTENIIIDFSDGDSNDWLYVGTVDYEDATEDKMHMAWLWYDFTAGTYLNVYYAYLNLADNHMYNATDSDLGTTISKSESDSSCIVYDTGTSNVGYAPKVHVYNSIPYVIWSEYDGSNKGWRFSKWNGNSWDSPETIVSFDYTTERGNSGDFIVHSASDIEAYLTTSGLDSDHGGNIEKWIWGGSTWAKIATILTESLGGIEYNTPQIVRNYRSDLKVVLCEYDHDDYSTARKVYAWGGNQNYTSPRGFNALSDTWSWANFTWSNSSVPLGRQVQWRIYYNNTFGDTNQTDVETFRVVEKVTGTSMYLWNTTSSTISSISYSADHNITLTFTVTATGTSTTNVYCADTGPEGGKPTDVSGGTYTFSADTKIATITVTHSSSEEVVITWETEYEESKVSGGTIIDDIDFLMLYLTNLDFIGFFVACYTTRIGEAFYALVMLAFSIVLYNRTESLPLLCILWILVGSMGFILAAPVISPFAVILMSLGIIGLIYKVVWGGA